MTRTPRRTLTLLTEDPPPIGAPKEPARLLVELGANAGADLTSLVEREGLNKTTIVNRAIQVYKLVSDAQLRGENLYVGTLADGTAKEVRIM